MVNEPEKEPDRIMAFLGKVAASVIVVGLIFLCLIAILRVAAFMTGGF